MDKKQKEKKYKEKIMKRNLLLIKNCIFEHNNISYHKSKKNKNQYIRDVKNIGKLVFHISVDEAKNDNMPHFQKMIW